MPQINLTKLDAARAYAAQHGCTVGDASVKIEEKLLALNQPRPTWDLDHLGRRKNPPPVHEASTLETEVRALVDSGEVASEAEAQLIVDDRHRETLHRRALVLCSESPQMTYGEAYKRVRVGADPDSVARVRHFADQIDERARVLLRQDSRHSWSSARAQVARDHGLDATGDLLQRAGLLAAKLPISVNEAAVLLDERDLAAREPPPRPSEDSSSREMARALVDGSIDAVAIERLLQQLAYIDVRAIAIAAEDRNTPPMSMREARLIACDQIFQTDRGACDRMKAVVDEVDRRSRELAATPGLSFDAARRRAAAGMSPQQIAEAINGAPLPPYAQDGKGG